MFSNWICLYYDGKFGGRKWKTSITSVEAHRSANNDETNQSDSKKEENFRAWRLWKDLCELVHLLQKGNESTVEETSAYAKKTKPNHIFEECRPNGFSILWEDKASCEQSSHFTSNGVWAYKMCIWQLVAYKKSECLGNGFMRTSRNLLESKTLFLYLFLDEGNVGCVSSMRIAHIHESLPSCRNWEQKYTSCWADTSWNT